MNSDTYRDAVWPFLAETTPQVTEVLDRLHRAATAEGVGIDGITVTETNILLKTTKNALA